MVKYNDHISQYITELFTTQDGEIEKIKQDSIDSGLPAISIKPEEGRFLQRECHDIRFDEAHGYDLKISVGTAVSVSDRFARVVFSTPEMFDTIHDLKNHTITFSFPVNVIGNPTAPWKYFVGVGLMSNRSMNFLYGGPEPVRGRRHRHRGPAG